MNFSLERGEPRQARTYNVLGSLAYKQKQLEQAEHCFQKALDTYIELNDRHEQANINHNLGSLAKEQKRWKEAEQYFKKALEIFIELNDF